MFCKNCGAKLDEGAKFCPKCGKTAAAEPSMQQPATEAPVASQPKQRNGNPLVGKEYTLASTAGAALFSVRRYGKIINIVNVLEDRLMITTTPNRFNSVPAVILEDVTAINISYRFHIYHIIFIILSVMLALWSSLFYFILTALLLYAGADHKIKISQRSGKDVILYSANKQAAEEFKADMKTITKIE